MLSFHLNGSPVSTLSWMTTPFSLLYCSVSCPSSAHLWPGPQPLSPQGLPALLPKEQAVHSQPSETGWPPVQRLPNVQRQWLVKSCSHGFPFSLTPISTLSTALPHLPSICFQATGSQQIPKSDFPAPESITAITQPALAPVLPSIPPPTSVTDVLSYLTKDSEQDLEFPLL